MGGDAMRCGWLWLGAGSVAKRLLGVSAAPPSVPEPPPLLPGSDVCSPPGRSLPSLSCLIWVACHESHRGELSCARARGRGPMPLTAEDVAAIETVAHYTHDEDQCYLMLYGTRALRPRPPLSPKHLPGNGERERGASVERAYIYSMLVSLFQARASSTRSRSRPTTPSAT